MWNNEYSDDDNDDEVDDKSSNGSGDKYNDDSDDNNNDEQDDKYNDESDDEYNYKENAFNNNNFSNNNQTQNQIKDLVNYNNLNNYNKFIDYYSNKGYQISFRRTQEVDKDGKTKFNSEVIFTKQPRKIEKVIKEYTSEYVEGTTLKPIVRSYKTGIIFKDTHYYTDYEEVKCPYKKNYERTVTYYSDGTIDYSDLREI